MIKLVLEFETTKELLDYLGTAKKAPPKKKAAKKAGAPVTATTPPAPPVTPAATVPPGAEGGPMSPSGLTLPVLLEHLKGLQQQLGPRAEELGGLLTQFGVKTTSELPADQYDRFLESAQALVVPV